MLSDPTLSRHKVSTQTFDMAKKRKGRNNKHYQSSKLFGALVFMVSIGKG